MNGQILFIGLGSLGLFVLMLPFLSAVLDSVLPMYNVNVALVGAILIPLLFIIFLVRAFFDAS